MSDRGRHADADVPDPRETAALLAAISDGHIDGLVIGSSGAERVVTLSDVELPYRIIVEHLGDGALVLDRSGTILFSNDRFTALVQREPGSLIGVSAREVIGGVVDELTALPRDQTWSGQWDAPASTGLRRTVLVARAAFDSGADIICCVVTDVTDLATLESRIQEQRLKLDRNEARLQMAREVNDTIVQGLAAIEMLLDLGDHGRAMELVTGTAAHARQLIGELVGGQGLEADGVLRTSHARIVGKEE